jgi:hypothetical protein
MKSFRILAVLLLLLCAADNVFAQKMAPPNSVTMADLDLLRSDIRRVEDNVSRRIRDLENRPSGANPQLEARVRELEARLRDVESRNRDLLDRIDRLERNSIGGTRK